MRSSAERAKESDRETFDEYLDDVLTGCAMRLMMEEDGQEWLAPGEPKLAFFGRGEQVLGSQGGDLLTSFLSRILWASRLGQYPGDSRERVVIQLCRGEIWRILAPRGNLTRNIMSLEIERIKDLLRNKLLGMIKKMNGNKNLMEESTPHVFIPVEEGVRDQRILAQLDQLVDRVAEAFSKRLIIQDILFTEMGQNGETLPLEILASADLT